MAGDTRAPKPDVDLAQASARIAELRRHHGLVQRRAVESEREAAISDASAVRPDATTPSALEKTRRDLEHLRSQRARRDATVTIGALLASIDLQNTRVHQRLGALIELWRSEVPPELASHTELTALRGGNLHVRAETSAIAFELDRLLRGGLLARLRRGHSGPLTRVRIAVK